MAQSFELHLPKANSSEASSHVDNATWDAYTQPALVMQVSTKSGEPSRAATSSSRATSDAAVTDKISNASTNTNKNTNDNTVKDTVVVTDNIRTSQTGTIAGALVGLSAGLAGGSRERHSKSAGSSGCVPFEIHANALIFGAGMTAPNTACVEHPQDLEYSLRAATQAVATMDAAGEQAKRAIAEGPTGSGQVDLNVANFKAEVSRHLAYVSTTAANRALDSREALAAPPLWSAEILNRNSPR
jgi:hypothetical protein